MSKIFVLYHGPTCVDGFAAAWAVHRVLGDFEVSYTPMQYGDKLPEGIGRHDVVFMLDFSMKRAAIEKLARSVRALTVIDHHKTAKEELEGLDGTIPGLHVVFDMDRSGAVLAWEYFFPNQPVPQLLLYVQDRDLWTWQLPWSRAVSAALALEPKKFAVWDWMYDKWSTPWLPQFVIRGDSILDAQKAHVDAIVQHAVLADVGGWIVPVVNSPIFQSELGEALCAKYPNAPFSAVFFVKGGVSGEGNITFDLDEADEVWSLRSKGTFDVSTVAKAFGGGGHAPAADFSCKRGQQASAP
jgi:oligoribonuclease NrnB/cAMP/cGMP phosphodiesterase (DHH superfamily)